MNSFGQNLPPTGMVSAHTYGAWNPTSFDTCPKQLHDTYWSIGDDAKTYPTWHPPVGIDPATNQQCTFGHEHGLDPRTSPHFLTQGAPTFGRANEGLQGGANVTSADYRLEDHVGFKVAVFRYQGSWQNTANDANMATAQPMAGVWCDIMMQYHQGTHSPDAFSNHLHELKYDSKCSAATGVDAGKYPGNPVTTDVHVRALVPLGEGGKYTNNCTSQKVVTTAAIPASGPHTNPGSGTVDGERNIPCLKENWSNGDQRFNQTWGPKYLGDLRELWTYGLNIQSPHGTIQVGPYVGVFNPARVVDPANNALVQSINQCYRTDNFRNHAPVCTDVKAVPGTVSWNDPRSPFNGTLRSFAPKATYIWNNAATSRVWYSDAYGRYPSYTTFAGSIRQEACQCQGMVEGAMVNNNVPTSLGAGGFEALIIEDNRATGVHAPN